MSREDLAEAGRDHFVHDAVVRQQDPSRAGDPMGQRFFVAAIEGGPLRGQSMVSGHVR